MERELVEEMKDQGQLHIVFKTPRTCRNGNDNGRDWHLSLDGHITKVTKSSVVVQQLDGKKTVLTIESIERIEQYDERVASRRRERW